MALTWTLVTVVPENGVVSKLQRSAGVQFDEPCQVIGFVKCECPGRSLIPNMGMAIKMSEMKPDKIYLSSCFANAKPGCPYNNVRGNG